MIRIDEILDKLDGVLSRGSGWVALCPAHDDTSPSLSIHQGEDKVLIHCHAGCSYDSVMTSLGIAKEGGGSPQSEETGDPEATYDYVNEEGSLLYQVVRYPPKNGKKRFTQRRPDGEGDWVYKLDDVRRVLYKLPEVIKGVEDGQVIFVAEGEKDVEALKSAGKIATCNMGGAGGWKPDYSSFFTGATVCIVADKDEPGYNHAKGVAKSLDGYAKDIFILNAKEGKDAYDHLIEHGLPTSEFVTVAEDGELVLASLVPRNVEWHHKPFVQVSAFHMLAGHGGVGKGTWLAGLAAEITTGRTDYLQGDPKCVLIVASEDSAELDLLPRIVAAGGDPSRVILLTKKIILPRDLEYLKDKINLKRNGVPTGMVVIDPVANHVGGKSTDDEGAVRQAINELNQIADQTNCAIFGVRHVPKHGYGVLGSVAWENSPRIVLMMNEGLEGKRYIEVWKSNRGAKGAKIAYDMQAIQIPDVTEPVPFLTRSMIF